MEMLMKQKTTIIKISILSLIMILTIAPLAITQQESFAIYNDLKSDVFMTAWWITESITVSQDTTERKDAEKQNQAFENESITIEDLWASIPSGRFKINDNEVRWKKVTTTSNSIDLIKEFGQQDYAYIYAAAKVMMDKESTMLLGVSSDDGIKIWVNGELVHKFWIGRAIGVDDDLVRVTLKKGSNSIVLKVQNQQGGWAFVCRRLGPASFPSLLVANAGRGNLDNVKILLANGADVNATVDPGMTALNMAKLKGRDELAQFLIEHGANKDVPMPAKEKLVSQLFERPIKAEYPGAAVLIAQNGKILFEQGYGLANREKKIPIIPATTFRIGSVTKQFTAAAILKLQEQGLLSLDDKLSKYIPDFPRGDEVTLYHLLTHTSGIHSLTNVHNFMSKVAGPITQEELIREIKGYNYDFDPGTSWIYNNSGYFLLGYIVEKVSGMSYGDYLKKTFLEPLGMTNTGVYSKAVAFKSEAIGYAYENNAVATALDWNMDFAGGAGNLYSNVGDLYKWNEAIFTGKVLSPKSLEAAFAPARLKNGDEANAFNGGRYGLGWALSSWRGLKEIQHGGGLPGFSSQLTRFPQDSLTIVVLSNCLSNIPDLNPGLISREIAEIYLNDHMEKQPTYTAATLVDKKILDDYVGQYDYRTAMMTITRKGDHLYAQLTGQSEFEIFPKGNDEFFWKIVEASVKFVRDETGKVVRLVHRQGGRTFEAPRVEPQQAISLDSAIMKNYVGDYELMPGAIISITLEGNQLYAQVTGQQRFEIYPSSATEFFFKVVNAKITFLMDESNQTTSLKLDQGAAHIVAKKIAGKTP
jgi:CubicO group peptidase (beta-lactamase class C family)